MHITVIFGTQIVGSNYINFYFFFDALRSYKMIISGQIIAILINSLS